MRPRAMPPLRHKERGSRTSVCVSYSPLSLADQVRCNAVFSAKENRKQKTEYRSQNSVLGSHERKASHGRVHRFELYENTVQATFADSDS